MATNQVDVAWTHDLCFDAHQQGTTFKLRSGIAPNEPGVSPKQLLLTALAGCTGMDVVSLLPKMRVPFTTFVVKVTGELGDEHPKAYTDIHVVYEVGASEEYREQVARAVELSESRYCGVNAMLTKAAKITHEIVFVE